MILNFLSLKLSPVLLRCTAECWTRYTCHNRFLSSSACSCLCHQNTDWGLGLVKSQNTGLRLVNRSSPGHHRHSSFSKSKLELARQEPQSGLVLHVGRDWKRIAVLFMILSSIKLKRWYSWIVFPFGSATEKGFCVNSLLSVNFGQFQLTINDVGIWNSNFDWMIIILNKKSFKIGN